MSKETKEIEIKIPDDMIKPGGDPPIPAPPAQPAPPKEGEPPAPPAPQVPPALPVLDTVIAPSPAPSPPADKKTPEEYAAERRQAKEKRKTDEQDAARAAEALILSEKERDAAKKEAEAARKELEAARKELESLRDQNKTAQERYLEAFKPKPSLGSDQEMSEARDRFVQTFTSELPTLVGDKRIFPAQIMSDQAMSRVMQNAATHYASGFQRGDENLVNMAISAVAQVIGVPDVIVSANPAETSLLPKTNPIYAQIDKALRSSTPHIIKMSERAAAIVNEGPKIEEVRIKKKTGEIAERLTSSIFLSPEESTEALKKDPTSSVALFAKLIDSSPNLKPIIAGHIKEYATALGRVVDGIDLPLMATDEHSIAAHRQEIDRTQATWREISQLAVIGKMSGAIIQSLIGQLAAANSRLSEHSKNTDPGPPSPEGVKAPPVKPLETDIVP